MQLNRQDSLLAGAFMALCFPKSFVAQYCDVILTSMHYSQTIYNRVQIIATFSISEGGYGQIGNLIRNLTLEKQIHLRPAVKLAYCRLFIYVFIQGVQHL